MRNRWPAILILGIFVAMGLSAATPEAEEVTKLDAEVASIRLSLGAEADTDAGASLRGAGAARATLQLQLAMALQRLNHIKPDGGKRVPEAERAYRCATCQIACKAFPDRVVKVGDRGARLFFLPVSHTN